jgi:hypothetical protein
VLVRITTSAPCRKDCPYKGRFLILLPLTPDPSPTFRGEGTLKSYYELFLPPLHVMERGQGVRFIKYLPLKGKTASDLLDVFAVRLDHHPASESLTVENGSTPWMSDCTN